MKTAFLPPPAAALTHPTWLCRIIEDSQGLALPKGLADRQDRAGGGALGGEEAGETLLSLQGALYH